MFLWLLISGAKKKAILNYPNGKWLKMLLKEIQLNEIYISEPKLIFTLV